MDEEWLAGADEFTPGALDKVTIDCRMNGVGVMVSEDFKVELFNGAPPLQLAEEVPYLLLRVRGCGIRVRARLLVAG